MASTTEHRRAGDRVGSGLSAETRRRQVLQSAIRCLARDGYDRVRLRDIAREAGVSTGVIQHHFDSREELLEQACRQASDELLDAWAAAVAGVRDPWQRIVALLRELTEQPQIREHCITWIEFVAASTRHPALREGVATIYGAWAALLNDAVADGVAAGQFQPLLPPADAVAVLLAFIDGCELALAADVGGLRAAEVERLSLALAVTLLNLTPQAT